MLQKTRKINKKETKKKKEERVVSEQAPPAAKAKEKPDRIPLPNDKKEWKKIKLKKNKNPEEIKPQIRQSSEFEKKEVIDTNQIAALIDKAKEIEAEKKIEKNNYFLLLCINLNFQCLCTKRRIKEKQ